MAPPKVAPPKVAPPKVAPPKVAPPKVAENKEPTAKPDIHEIRLQQLQARLDRARAAIAKGDKALADGQADQAVTFFEKAIEIAPELDEARQRLETARNQVGEGDEGAAALTRLDKINKIAREKNDVSYSQALKRSHEALQGPKTAASFDRARDEAQYARTLMETSRHRYSSADYRVRKLEIDERLRYIALTRATWEKEEVAKQILEVQKEEGERQREADRRKRDKLRNLEKRVRSLRRDEKYAQAVDVLDEILSIDPSNSRATDERDELGRWILIKDHTGILERRNEEEMKTFNAVADAQIPWYDLLRYPDDWPALTLRRQEGGAGRGSESDANRKTRKSMRNILPQVEFISTPFKDVVDFFRNYGGVSIYVNWGALQGAGIDDASTVTVRLRNVSFEKALKTALEDLGGGTTPLRYVVDEGVITISTKDDLDQKTLTRSYDIRDLIVRVPSFQGPKISLESSDDDDDDDGGGGSLFGDSTTGTGGSGGGSTVTETTVTRQELINSILELIQETIDRDSWGGEIGSGPGSIRELGGQIIVTQTAENHRQMLDLLGMLREAKALQINVEARFISVSTGFLNHIGVDLDFYFNLGSDLRRVPLTSTGPQTVDALTGSDIVGSKTFYGWPQWRNRPSWSDNMTPVQASQAGNVFTTPVATPISGATSIGSSVTGSALTIAGTFMDAIQVDFLINATQAHSDTRTLTAPRLTLFNGQRAYVSVGNEEAYVSNVEFVPGTGDNALGGFNRTISHVTTGTVLDVEATVSADRRYVTLTMRPQVSKINSFVEYLGTPGVPGSGLIQLPNITRQVLECTVSVPDGGTLLLGGQKLAAEVEKEMGVPLLSKIPILKRAFTNTSRVRDEHTLLILVRPEIIIQKEYEDEILP